jgi:predicted amidophosphoribosyltransferase
MRDVCICCGSELSKMERNRSVCWECSHKVTETYDEENESNLIEDL